ncbi:hypothetical protein CDD81_4810 [Ophiocordyceps australis]|uniref:Uncharacterized protein n=1 Tax=Ophiocordyceps australis TaxID=1399860 RepID=A0A2C5XUE1_9HYPO|nr:hypothetical protein CDD81_4810 [Ophiocordyceps australis]
MYPDTTPHHHIVVWAEGRKDLQPGDKMQGDQKDVPCGWSRTAGLGAQGFSRGERATARREMRGVLSDLSCHVAGSAIDAAYASLLAWPAHGRSGAKDRV